MVANIKPTNLGDFEHFIAQPENAESLFEFIDGEIVEVSPGRTLYSQIEHIIAAAVREFCREHNIPCRTSGSDGAYRVGNHVVAPDFAYKRTSLSRDYPDPDPPLWAVEVISPTDKAANIRKKRNIYRDAGILLWEIYPELQAVDVYIPGQVVHELGADDILDAGEILPDFKIAVKDLFVE